MEVIEKVRMSSQLIALLPSTALKVLSFALMFQANPKGVMLYEHRFAKMLKMSDDEIKIAVQTLIDLKLISLTNVDGKFKINFNKEQFDKYFNLDMQKVLEHQGHKLATNVTYYKQSETQKQKDISSMSDSELRTLLLRVQASLNEREQLREIVKTPELPNDCDSLPF